MDVDFGKFIKGLSACATTGVCIFMSVLTA